MNPVFLVVGAPAVGKSTTAHALASRFEKSIHIPVDDVRDMVVSGLLYPSAEWGTGLIEQLRLARESVAQMARTYRQAGFVVVIDDFWDPNSRLLEYGELLDEPNTHKVLLYPTQQAAQERNRKRTGPSDASEYIAGGIQVVYEYLSTEVAGLACQGWMVLDTTDQSVEATVVSILAQHALS